MSNIVNLLNLTFFMVRGGAIRDNITKEIVTSSVVMHLYFELIDLLLNERVWDGNVTGNAVCAVELDVILTS